MKIIYLANLRLPTEKIHGFQIMKMCEAYSMLGELELVVPTRRNPIKDDPFAYYNIKSRFLITRLPVFDWLILEPILGRLAFYLLNLEFQLTARIYLLFRKYDMIITREAWTGLLFRGYLLEVHTLTPRGRKFTAWSARRASAVVTVSAGLKEDLTGQGIAPDQITVLPNGVDTSEFEALIDQATAKARLGWPEDRKVALYGGSFNLDSIFDWKGTDVLIEAARLAPEIDFVLVGGRSGEIATLAEKYPLPNLRFIAKRPQAEFPLLLQAADVLVLPNKKTDAESERYTSPIKLFYYLASGRPVVAADLPAIRNIVSEREVAFFRAGDTADLARVIRVVLSDPTAAKRAEHCLEFVKEYTWEKRAERVIGLLGARF